MKKTLQVKLKGIYIFVIRYQLFLFHNFVNGIGITIFFFSKCI